MKFSEEILNELELIGPSLKFVDRTAPFSVPQNYFITLSSRLQIKRAALVKTQNEPEGYFTSLAERILMRIREDNEAVELETDSISGLLNGLKNKKVFTVPDGYFEKCSFSAPDLKKPAIVKPMFKNKQIWKQAVAAVVTGIIALNALWIFDQSGDKNIIHYNGPVSTYMQASRQYRSQEMINQGIAQLSNDDIIKYLTTNGSDADNETLISNMKDNDLPVQEPALSNEQSINEYLNN